MEEQRRLNKYADTLVGGETAPTLLDITTIQDDKHDLCIARKHSGRCFWAPTTWSLCNSENIGRN
jgi:hypothetical protein